MASLVGTGLVAKGKDTSFPLKNVSVEARVRGFVLGLHSTLTYSNDTSDPVEVLFRFPIEKSHAVVGLTALIDGRKIKADIREKEEARAQYDDAIASGLSAALAEEKSGDIFSVALGNLPSGKEAQIQLQLVGELSIDAEGGVRFSLPSTLKPRYTPAGSTDPLASVPTGEEQQVKSGSVSAVSWFHMTVEEAEAIAKVTSPTHSIKVTPKADVDQLHVHLSEQKKLGSDLVILLTMKEPHTPKAMLERGVEKKGEFMSSPGVMLNFLPNFAKVEAACEFIFLVDRSGSMSGAYIRSACETLMLFLKSIPEGNYFNIIGFGSSYRTLFPNTVPYDEKHLEKALKHAQEMEADLGGTELLSPLQYIFGTKPRSGYSRQVFVLTDGSVSNTNTCIQQMKSNVKNARCFTFGIGSGASTALVEGLAQAGNGAAEFVKEGERMQPKVIRSLKRALQPAITDVSVLFKVPKECEVLQCPQNLPPIFNGEELVAYAIIKSRAKLKKTECTAILKGNLLGKWEEHKVPFTLNSTAEVPSLPVIHHLAAKALISDWESEGKEKKSIVDLSIESSVISSHTAFIAVDEESSEPVSGAMKTYDIRAQELTGFLDLRCGASQGWRLCSSAPMSMPMMSMPITMGISRSRAADEETSEPVSGAMKTYDIRAQLMCQQQAQLMCQQQAQLMCHQDQNQKLGLSLPTKKIKTCRSVSPPISMPVMSMPMMRSSRSRVDDALLGLGGGGGGPPPPAPQLSSGALPPPPPGYGALPTAPLFSRAVFGLSSFGNHRPIEKPTDNLTNLIAAQQVNGSWVLNSSLAKIIGKSLTDLESGCPVERKGIVDSVWATVLAVSILRARYSSQQDEWELIAMKAESWLKKQSLPSGCTLEQLFQAAAKITQ